jgi:hypothetical protein
MSDVGLYDGMEAELTAAVTGITGVVGVHPTLDVADLISRDGIRPTCIGITNGPAKENGESMVGQRLVPALAWWTFSVVVKNQRGAVSGRPELRRIQEEIRDRVHGLASTVAMKRKYRWQEDEPIELADSDLVASASTFKIQTTFGN